ncbi:PA3496 family putative envelope integrity protein [Kaarinaea lacus]
MNSITSNEINIPGENANLTIRGMKDVPGENVARQKVEVRQYNPSARRRIEDYLESKRLANLTMDYFTAD